MKICRDIMLHLITVPMLIGTVAYLSMDDKKKEDLKECLNKKIKKVSKEINKEM